MQIVAGARLVRQSLKLLAASLGIQPPRDAESLGQRMNQVIAKKIAIASQTRYDSKNSKNTGYEKEERKEIFEKVALPVLP